MAVDLHRDWLSAAEIAALALAAMPARRQHVVRLAAKEGWDRTDLARKRAGRGGGLEYHIDLLPEGARADLEARRAAASQKAETPPEQPRASDPQPPSARLNDAGRERLWAWFERQTDARKEEGRRRVSALHGIERQERSGLSRTEAVKATAAELGVSPSTIYAWIDRLGGVRRDDWLAALTPSPRGGAREKIELDQTVWAAFRTDYLRLSQPSFESCFRRAVAIAKAQGLPIPSSRTLRRRVAEIPAPVLIRARKGEEALKRLYPAQERDRSHFHALQAVNTDGHKWDVFVRWEDGTVGRPLTVAFQDLYSGKFLSWRTTKSENKDTVRLAFGDMIERYGIPDELYLDNGRAFGSKWLTGGIPNRYRFKVKAEEPKGIITQLGVNIHWTQPYAGQSKPIERGFGDFASDIAKHPAFEGAYTGNSPTAKPENYGSKAIPIAEFIAIIDREIAAHNARPGRRSKVCGGTLSFDQVFEASYEQSLIRKATEAQRRLCLLAAEGVTVRPNGTIELFQNRYFTEELWEHRGTRVTARFDPDQLHAPLLISTLDGRPIGEARLLEATGFDNTTAAREYAAERRKFMRGTREAADAEKKLSLADLAKLLPDSAPEPAAPSPSIIRPFFPTRGATALAAEDLPEEEASPASTLDFDEAFRRGLAKRRQAESG